MTREYHEGYQQGYKDAKEEGKEPTIKNDLGVDANKLLADCEKMSFDIEIFNKPLKVVALDAVKNIAKDLINSENPNKSEIPTGSTTKNDLGVERQIKEICISYPKSNLKEHDEKPYYTIKYVENSKEYQGYGTYKIEILMEYLKNYFMPSVTPIRPKGHWIGRKKVGFGEWKDCIVPLKDGIATDSCSCSECGEWLTGSDEYPCYGNFCPNCGADMRGEGE